MLDLDTLDSEFSRIVKSADGKTSVAPQLAKAYDVFPHSFRASLVAQLVKNLPAMWETWDRSLGWEDCLEKGKATHSSILA